MRAQWPADKPLSVRISATDWADGGLSDEDALTIVRAFRGAGIDLVDVSTGQTVPDQKPVYGRMWQTPFADRIRNEVGIATMAVGNIYEPDHVNSIIASGRADLCAIARPHLANPAWTLEAAARQGYRPQWWPKQYLSGKSQLERNLQRAAPARRTRVVSSAVGNGARLAGRHAVVTGASRGIGAVIAAALAAEGVRVSLLGRDAGNLERVSDELGGKDRAFPIVADVTDPPSVQSAFAAARAPLRPRALADQQRRTGRERQIHRYRRGAVEPPVRGQSAPAPTSAHAQAVPDMLAEGFGRIVNIASTAGLRGAAYISAYVELEACGHRPDPLAGSRIREPEHHGERGVPGLRRHRHREETRSPTSEPRRAAATARRSQRWSPPIRSAGSIEPREVADTVMWLCRPGSESVTGQSIVLAGGEVT